MLEHLSKKENNDLKNERAKKHCDAQCVLLSFFSEFKIFEALQHKFEFPTLFHWNFMALPINMHGR